MINSKNPRSYEVSIWTLQDSFITILKQSNLEHKGQIEEPKISLKDDSEDTFSFKIPMYIRRDGQKIENPIWYNTKNGNIMANLRKLKVIFNKHTQYEKVLEFLITKVTETHEGYQTYCEIESEGLAFNELGKTGYKIDLSEDLYNMEYNEWADASEDKVSYLEKYNITYSDVDTAYEAVKPFNNINYWLDKVFPNREVNGETIWDINWRYEINMDWSDFSGYSEGELLQEKIYEDPYIENWEEENGQFKATSLARAKEKCRIVSASQSNRYNITQTIAETFNVFCEYVYEYDENYHIIGRVVRFFNKTLKEAPIDFNYYYDTEDISREMDSADQITKMIVLSNNSDTDDVNNNIAEVNANKSLEDYLLNFDYLHSIGAITEEQYEEIEKFEIEMRKYNSDLKKINNQITILEDKLIECHALLENARIAKAEDENRIKDEGTYIKHLLNSDKSDYDNDPKTLSKTFLVPDIQVIHTTEENGRCVEFEQEYVIYEMKKEPKHPIFCFYNKSDLESCANQIQDTQENLSLIQQNNKYYVVDQVDNEGNPVTNAIMVEYIKKAIPDNATAEEKASIEKENNEAIQAAKNTVMHSWIIKTFSQYEIATQNLSLIKSDTLRGQTYYSGLTGIPAKDKNNNTIYYTYLIYSYEPYTYHAILLDDLNKKLEEDKAKVDKYQKIVDKLHGARERNDFDGKFATNDHGVLQELYDEYNELLKKKEEAILKFERLMGPALREGTWQPEDEYAKYGDKRQAEVDITWDNELFDHEEKNYYEEGIGETPVYYPCIKLNNTIMKYLINEHLIVSEENDFDIDFLSIEEKSKINDDTNPQTITIPLHEIGFCWDYGTIPGTLELIRNYNETVTDDKKLPENNFPYSLNIGSEAQLCFIRKKQDYLVSGEQQTVIPVLMLTNAESYIKVGEGENLIEKLKDLNGVIGRITTEVVKEEVSTGQVSDELINTLVRVINTPLSSTTPKTHLLSIKSDDWIVSDDLEKYETVYPRYSIEGSYSFKNNTNNYSLKLTDGTILSPFFDYEIYGRFPEVNLEDPNKELNIEKLNTDYTYFLTIKPETMFRYYSPSSGTTMGTWPSFNFNYELSNTGLAIYLDARKVMQENAWPKVTYEITPKIVKTNFMINAYDRMHQLIHINDHDLKFENVMGYISGLELDLDKPWEDSIEIKNYKTKFEDLFSSIVASTAQIEKNSTVINALASTISTNGILSPSSIQETLRNGDLQLAYSSVSDGTFSVDKNGILATNSNGAVTYTSAGIFTATEKDSNGQWAWNTGILPTGISAKAITSGQIDTNLVRIYSGTDLRLVLKEDGLFAYKSWLSNENPPSSDVLAATNGLDPAQYVVHNSDGLFLVAKAGAEPEYQEISYRENPLEININNKTYIINNAPIFSERGVFDYTTLTHEPLEQDVNRVEISWDGLKLRNWNNEITFYADPNTGDLILSGTLIGDTSYLTVPKGILDAIYNAEHDPEIEGAGENDINTSSSMTFENYIIDAMNKNNESVRYLRPDVATIKMDNYIEYKAGYSSNILSNYIGYKYSPILKNLQNGIQDYNGNSLPNVTNDDIFKAYRLKKTIISESKEYAAGTTIWYAGDGVWETLENSNINIGTGGSINVLGGNIIVGANSELNLIAGSSFNAIAGNEVLIASAEHTDNGVGDGTPDLNGSYIWMHDVNIGTEENPNYQKQLDIGTTGEFNISASNFNLLVGEESDTSLDEYITNSSSLGSNINSWFQFDENGITITKGDSEWSTITSNTGYQVVYNNIPKFSVEQNKCIANSLQIGKVVIQSTENGMMWIQGGA